MGLKIEDFRHPDDLLLMDKILHNPVADTIEEYIKRYDIEHIYTYFDKTSCIEITKNISPTLYTALLESCYIFGLTKIPKLYLKRDYNSTIELHGFNEPYIVISSQFLAKLDKKFIIGFLSSQIAGILAEHHKTLFLLSVADLLSKSVPILSTIIDVTSNQWSRNRFYTYDRAFYLSTKDYTLTLQSILINTLPADSYRTMFSGTEKDVFLNQMHDFIDTKSIPKAYYFIFKSNPWLPARYNEIMQYHADGRR